MITNYDNLPANLTVKETADLLRMSPNHLYYLVQNGTSIPFFRIGRKVLFPKDELLAWMKAKSGQK